MVRAGDTKAMSSLSLLGKVTAGAIRTSQQKGLCLVFLLCLIQCSKVLLFSMRMFLWMLIEIHMGYNPRLETIQDVNKMQDVLSRHGHVWQYLS